MASIKSDKAYMDYKKIDHDKSKEMSSNDSNEICDDAGMKDKSIKEIQANTDKSKEITSNKCSEVCMDVCMIDDLTIEEHAFKINERRMTMKVDGDKSLRSYERNQQEDDNLLQKANFSSNRSIGKRSSAANADDSEWYYNVIHIDSCDLQVVGNHDAEEFTSRNCHQDTMAIQNVANKVTETKEIIPITDIGKSQPKSDRRLTPLRFRKILPRVNPSNKIFNHNIEVQGKQDLMHSILHPAKCEQYTCCEKTNKHEENLNGREHDDAFGRQYKCTYCNKTFATQSDVEKHECTHTCEKTHKCTYCNKAFPRQSHLKRHELIHTGASPHKCRYCGKTFRNRWDVEVHERIHTGVKPYTCALCNKAFTQRSGLNVHGRVHTGITPYQCKQCNKAFTRKSHLMEHERIHTGVKPYKCTYCNKDFTQKGTLKKHERTHTGVKSYKCENCDKAFTSRSDLSKHEDIHTSEKT